MKRREVCPEWLWWLALLAAGVYSFALAGHAWGAPHLPRPRVTPPLTESRLAGRWKAHWGATPCEVTLAASGAYRCRWHGSWYVGHWGVRGPHLYLAEYQEESLRGGAGYCVDYRPEPSLFRARLDPATLSGPLQGGLPGGGWRDARDTGAVLRLIERLPDGE